MEKKVVIQPIFCSIIKTYNIYGEKSIAAVAINIIASSIEFIWTSNNDRLKLTKPNK